MDGGGGGGVAGRDPGLLGALLPRPDAAPPALQACSAAAARLWDVCSEAPGDDGVPAVCGELPRLAAAEGDSLAGPRAPREAAEEEDAGC